MVTFKQGDIIIMDFNPQQGHEQNGRRPALVVSNTLLNEHSSLIMVCPITNTDKSHPFHVNLDDSTSVKGVILADQAKMLDVRTRHARFVEKCPEDIWMEAIEIIKNFL